MAVQTKDGGAIDLAVPHLREWPARALPGLPVLGLSLLALLVGVRLLAGAHVLASHAGHSTVGSPASLIGGLLIVLGGVALGGLTAVAPGQARVVQLFGRYRGTSAPAACAG